jgi:predicted ATP-dependent endonuclease of OLD family
MGGDGVQIENATSRAELLTELGYSIADNLLSDLVILCEGPTDKPVLEEFLTKMVVYDRNAIKIWPLGGDIMDQLDLSVFSQSTNVMALIDNDPKSDKIRKRFEANCLQLQIPITRLKRYALENYFSLDAIESVMKGQMPEHITEIDPNKRVSDQLGFEVKRNNRKIARATDINHVRGTDLGDFLERVGELAKQGQVGRARIQKA